jgi:CRISPR/Cas system endoribonuclease Cas6 (RAMP superfamily)
MTDSCKSLAAHTENDLGDHPVEPMKSHIDLTFLTPVQIWKGKRLVHHPEFGVFMDTLFARIAALIDVYETEPFTLPYGMLLRKPHVHLELSKDTWHRVEICQAQQTFRGYCGKLRYSGDLHAYLPYLRLGERIHVGKLTTRGFGEYRLE